MRNDLKIIMVNGTAYKYNPEHEYIKDGHAYCKICHERKDGEVLDFLGSKIIFRKQCKCDRLREQAEKERVQQQEILNLKKRCFISNSQHTYTFENYQGENYTSYLASKNYVKNFDQMKKENIGLLFFGTVGSGKTYLACAIANALIEEYQIAVKMKNFAQIINDLQKNDYDFDKNAYIESIINVPVLILDDLGIERDTSYAKEQVYNIINSRYLKHKPTIFTTNVPIEELQSAESGIEYERIYSRITEMCIPIKVTGKDFRKILQREKLEKTKKILLEGVSI